MAFFNSPSSAIKQSHYWYIYERIRGSMYAIKCWRNYLLFKSTSHTTHLKFILMCLFFCLLLPPCTIFPRPSPPISWCVSPPFLSSPLYQLMPNFLFSLLSPSFTSLQHPLSCPCSWYLFPLSLPLVLSISFFLLFHFSPFLFSVHIFYDLHIFFAFTILVFSFSSTLSYPFSCLSPPCSIV